MKYIKCHKYPPFVLSDPHTILKPSNTYIQKELLKSKQNKSLNIFYFFCFLYICKEAPLSYCIIRHKRIKTYIQKKKSILNFSQIFFFYIFKHHLKYRYFIFKTSLIILLVLFLHKYNISTSHTHHSFASTPTL